ncbi:hypothetical protein TNCV_4077081 [Trichonephila clavipes]|nr:hypothetical protein TNCV_4077081 [Trichonephila clavipes]
MDSLFDGLMIPRSAYSAFLSTSWTLTIIAKLFETTDCIRHCLPRPLGGSWVTWWLEHRTPDRKACVRYPMPPNTLRVHTEYVLVKSVGPKVSCGRWQLKPQVH